MTGNPLRLSGVRKKSVKTSLKSREELISIFIGLSSPVRSRSTSSPGERSARSFPEQ